MFLATDGGFTDDDGNQTENPPPNKPSACQDCLMVSSQENCADVCQQNPPDGIPPENPCHACLKEHSNASWYDALWICADACPQVKGQNSANGPIANVFLISLVVVTRLLIFW